MPFSALDSATLGLAAFLEIQDKSDLFCLVATFCHFLASLSALLLFISVPFFLQFCSTYCMKIPEHFPNCHFLVTPHVDEA
jgi:hypothetical protein